MACRDLLRRPDKNIVSYGNGKSRMGLDLESIVGMARS